ncbi:uncharacterized protein KNAG_0E03630 [Huiozyma naganishii CBS 8797]|uniref:RRM domain-containing protein n=1 Tax=Huiozyma naganishii (strain ATCC MYA-139 / BCRC 22969 / CBS 8797 / KCTC 17520 / NBRC 10181 / NCYC 3082 / Yp74L-3) TaxID=1071383 RepID=J7R6Y5_HUIN7|nr:hypothetical protein KNAG_0E03630 [Kazachstania naganishii CBS 8797]CCK70620.1 hypothetical protein KNAG_0E03630 [Kazachstania naganishii CBS 8797]
MGDVATVYVSGLPRLRAGRSTATLKRDLYLCLSEYGEVLQLQVRVPTRDSPHVFATMRTAEQAHTVCHLLSGEPFRGGTLQLELAHETTKSIN